MTKWPAIAALTLVVAVSGCGADEAEPPQTAAASPTQEQPSPPPTSTEAGSRISLDEAHAYATEHGWTAGAEEFEQAALTLCDGMAEYGAEEWMVTTANVLGLTADQGPVMGAMAVYGCPTLADEIAPDGHADLVG